MSATVDTNTDWQAETIRLKASDPTMTSEQIAAVVGKHAGTIRKVLKRNADEIERVGQLHDHQTTVDEQIATTSDRIVWTGENWPEFRAFLGRPVDSPLVAYKFDFLGPDDENGEPVRVTAEPGDTVIKVGDRFIVKHPVSPEDDPDHTNDPLDDFRAEAGEAVGPMPPDPNPPEPLSYDVRLAGTQQMALDFGPESDPPVGGTLKLKSDKLASGFYGLGDVITGTFTARIVDVAGAERFQRASEEFRIQPQQHVGLITELSIDVGASG